jgi:hypothetical protein
LTCYITNFFLVLLLVPTPKKASAPSTNVELKTTPKRAKQKAILSEHEVGKEPIGAEGQKPQSKKRTRSSSAVLDMPIGQYFQDEEAEDSLVIQYFSRVYSIALSL